MGKILRTVNLIVNAIKPKQVTWKINKDGSGYVAEEKEMEDKVDIELEDPKLESKQTKEPELPFEAYLTDSGIPWCGPNKGEKAQTNITSFEESDRLTTDQLKTLSAMQETLASKLKMEKIIEKKCHTYISSLTNSRFTREELIREKKADLETRKRLQILLEKLKPKNEKELKPQMNTSSSLKCRYTTEELAREKKADLETRKRLQEFLAKIKTTKNKDIATLFDPLQGAEYYLNRYNSEPAFKAWFNTNFQDYTIEKVLEFAIPQTFSKSKSQSEPDLHHKNSDLQKYIDIYNNEPMYKDWFDRKYPGLSIYDIVGMPESQ